VWRYLELTSRRAVDEFLAEHGLDGSVLSPVAGAGAVWQEP
jgi:hypothetical protein